MSTPKNGSNIDPLLVSYDEAAAGTKARAESVSERYGDNPLSRSATASAPVDIQPLFPKGAIK